MKRLIDIRPTGIYTPGMKTAVSIPDALFDEGEKLAQDLSLSRSALYATALREMIERRRDAAITAAIDAALAEQQQEPDQSYARRMRRELKRHGGKW